MYLFFIYDIKKKSNSSWGKKDKSKKDENKKSKFDWIKKLNIFKKSESK